MNVSEATQGSHGPRHGASVPNAAPDCTADAQTPTRSPAVAPRTAIEAEADLVYLEPDQLTEDRARPVERAPRPHGWLSCLNSSRTRPAGGRSPISLWFLVVL